MDNFGMIEEWRNHRRKFISKKVPRLHFCSTPFCMTYSNDDGQDEHIFEYGSESFRTPFTDSPGTIEG